MPYVGEAIYNAAPTARLGAINLIQRGTISVAMSLTADATITSVETTRAILGFLGIAMGLNDATPPVAFSARLSLENATTVRATANGVGGSNSSNAVVGYQVVEHTS